MAYVRICMGAEAAMSTQVQAAIIAGVVGLITASVGALVTFLQARKNAQSG